MLPEFFLRKEPSILAENNHKAIQPSASQQRPRCDPPLFSSGLIWGLAWNLFPMIPVSLLAITMTSSVMALPQPPLKVIQESEHEPAVSALAPSQPAIPVPQPLSPEVQAELTRTIKALSTQLDHPDFSTRELAQDQLSKVTPAAVSLIDRNWPQKTLEQRVRWAGILREWFIKADDQMASDISDVMEELSDTSEGSTKDQITASFREFEGRRAEIATKQFQQLGGVIESQAVDFGVAGRPLVRPGKNDDNVRSHAVIGRQWTGGDEGIKHLARIPRLDLLYLVKGAPVSPAGLAQLQSAVPGLQVQERGAAYLGITATQGVTPLEIRGVKEESPAAKAGLRAEDIVVRFGKDEAGTFENLVKLIGEKQPGDKIEGDILRNGRRLMLTVELSEWVK